MDKIDYFSLLTIVANRTSNLLISLRYKKKRRWMKMFNNTIFSWNSQGIVQKNFGRPILTCEVVTEIYGALIRCTSQTLITILLLLLLLLLLVLFYFYYYSLCHSKLRADQEQHLSYRNREDHISVIYTSISQYILLLVLYKSFSVRLPSHKFPVSVIPSQNFYHVWHKLCHIELSYFCAGYRIVCVVHPRCYTHLTHAIYCKIFSTYRISLKTVC